MYKVFKVGEFHKTADTIRRLVRPERKDGIVLFDVENENDCFAIESEDDLSCVVIGINNRSYLVSYDEELIEALSKEFAREDINVPCGTIVTDSVFGVKISDTAADKKHFYVLTAMVPQQRLCAMVYFYKKYGADYERPLGLDPKFSNNSDDAILREMRMLAV